MPPIVGLILVGLVAGWLTGKVMKGKGFGMIVDTLLGVAGAFVGDYLARFLRLQPTIRTGEGAWLYLFVVAVAGSVLLVWLFRLIRPSKA